MILRTWVVTLCRAAATPTVIWRATRRAVTRAPVVSITSQLGRSSFGARKYFKISLKPKANIVPLLNTSSKSQLRGKQFLMDDPKYKGKKSSRKAALGFESEEEDEEEDEDMAFDSDHNEDDDDEEMASDDLDDGEDLMAGIDHNEDSEEEEEASGSDEDQDENDDEDDDEEDEDDSEGEDEEDGYGDFSASGITETPQEMQEELQKIQQEEKELLKSMTKSVTDDVEKGIHVKAQMVRTLDYGYCPHICQYRPCCVSISLTIVHHNLHH